MTHLLPIRQPMHPSAFSETRIRGVRVGKAILNIVTDFAEQGWAIRENFLDEQHWRAMADEAGQLWEQGAFRKAGMGRLAEHRLQAEIRGDYSLWLDPQQTPAAFRFVAEELEALRAALNASLYLGLFEFEAHLAIYPPGASYARHVDQLHGSAARRVSMAFYLNDGWRATDGGELCLYPPSIPRRAVTRKMMVLPAGGTLAVFGSADMPHAVRPATRPRLSLSGWFRSRA